jgi:hypothetical protein
VAWLGVSCSTLHLNTDETKTIEGIEMNGMILLKWGSEGVNWIKLAQNSFHRRVSVVIMINLRI